MSSSSIPDKQRALILQGGGALGAYDAGVLQVLIEELPKIDALKNETGRPLFDIIAGTSSGAINAALLAIFYRDNGTWKGAGDRVAKYWTGGSFNIDRISPFKHGGGMKSIVVTLWLLVVKLQGGISRQNIFSWKAPLVYSQDQNPSQMIGSLTMVRCQITSGINPRMTV
jgi:predicted acylesterase/phospholipase RssA